MLILTRRHFLAATAGALGAAALGDGFLLEPAAVQVTRHELPIPGLPAALDGVRIACLADVHLHRGISRAARAALEQVDRERPEIVVLAGDICNKRGDLPTLTAWARDARGTLATFATFGNWERYAKIDRATAEAAYGKAGVEFLCNTTARVSIRGATLTILGLDDPVEGRPDPMAALAGVGARDVAVWVLHGPGYVDELPKSVAPRPALFLAGHTHGGQIRLPGITPVLPVGSGRFVAGWYRDTVAPLYVSRGIGTVFVPARLFCPPELPVFSLRSSLHQLTP
ncbi:MAG: metallophosphoesterase [Gemmatimonadetes bacterium]|nr:MAG: metallophosphoesterase [Gemmatimonadota bacterium]